MPLKAGTVLGNRFAGTMAASIEAAFVNEWDKVTGYPLGTAGQRERRVLFAAIAQGIVRHLQDNPDAFKVAVAVEQEDPEGAPVESENVEDVRVSYDENAGGSYWDHLEVDKGEARVRQVSAAVRSRGGGAVEAIEVDEEAMS